MTNVRHEDNVRESTTDAESSANQAPPAEDDKSHVLTFDIGAGGLTCYGQGPRLLGAVKVLAIAQGKHCCNGTC